jgi:Glycosyltransferase family 87
MAAANGDKTLPEGANSRASRADRHWTSSLERIGFASLAALAVLYIAVVIALLPKRATRWDFSHYYASALVLREGGDPYTTDLTPLGAKLGLTLRQIDRGTYPPTFLLCISPLTRLSVWHAYIVWQTFSVACLIAGLAMLLHDTVPPRAARWLVLGVIFFGPMQLHLNLAQSQFMVFAMLVGAIIALERSREAEAGLIFAAAALLRAYPLAMAGYLVARRHWRTLGWMAAGLAAGSLITVAAVGLQNCLDFRTATKLITARIFLEQPSNIALGSFVSRMFWHLSDSGLIGPHELIRQGASFGSGLILGLAAFVITWTRQDNEPDPDRRAYSLWIATMILVSPTAWDHYLVLLVLPFVQITAAALAGRVDRAPVIACTVSYVLGEVSFLIFGLVDFVRSHQIITTELGFMCAATAWIGIAIFAQSSPAAAASSSRLAAASETPRAFA